MHRFEYHRPTESSWVKRLFSTSSAVKMCHRIIETEKSVIGFIIDFVMEKLNEQLVAEKCYRVYSEIVRVHACGKQTFEGEFCAFCVWFLFQVATLLCCAFQVWELGAIKRDSVCWWEVKTIWWSTNNCYAVLHSNDSLARSFSSLLASAQIAPFVLTLCSAITSCDYGFKA